MKNSILSENLEYEKLNLHLKKIINEIKAKQRRLFL